MLAEDKAYWIKGVLVFTADQYLETDTLRQTQEIVLIRIKCIVTLLWFYLPLKPTNIIKTFGHTLSIYECNWHYLY